MKKIILVLMSLFFSVALAASESKEFEVQDLNGVLVTNRSGDVKISAIDGPKAIVTATKNKFSTHCKIIMGKFDHKLVLKVEKRKSLFFTEECNVDFEVKVPKVIDLDLTIGSGDLTVNGIQGALVFTLGSGDISAQGLFKKIDGKSGSGNITVKGLTEGGKLAAGSGNIILTFASSPQKGEIDLKTGSGDATVLFPKGSKVKTNFIAGRGQLNNQLGESPSPSFLVSMEAGSGDLTVKFY